MGAGLATLPLLGFEPSTLISTLLGGQTCTDFDERFLLRFVSGQDASVFLERHTQETLLRKLLVNIINPRDKNIYDVYPE